MALELKPDFFQPLYNIGVILKQQGRFKEAKKTFKKALFIEPKNARIIYNIGTIYNAKKNFPLAIDYYKDALALEPDLELARAKKIHEQLGICDWNDIESEYKYLHQLGINKHHITPFALLSIEDEPERHKKRSEIFSNKKYMQKPLLFNIKIKEKNKVIRVGYFSSDFKTHPVAYLIAKVLEKHNRDQFKIYGYSINGNDEDHLRKRLMKTFDVFRDVKHRNDKEVALLAREDEIDIAIDLNGYTSNLRTRIFAYRAAPIQINFLGYPGTMGSDYMDYIIADHNLIPEKSQRFYSEKPIYLPYTYMPTDNTRQISLKVITRKEMGLPEKGFVFCCFNNNYKITPEEFDIWMRLLSKLKNSVLWLRKSNEWSEINLRKEAKRRNIDPDRLVFAEKLPMEEHLARQKLADLFLDTFNFNAHTTASEALWAGLPVVTKMGSGFASRVAGSLLNAIDCPELITYSKEEYENLVLLLANDAQKLHKIREKIEINRLIKPLFDTELYTKNLENGFKQAYENHLKGKKIDVINVSEGRLK
jgi:predicted O-linked N-acetylglucosamine transferase (SPINDLY family)